MKHKLSFYVIDEFILTLLLSSIFTVNYVGGLNYWRVRDMKHKLSYYIIDECILTLLLPSIFTVNYVVNRKIRVG